MSHHNTSESNNRHPKYLKQSETTLALSGVKSHFTLFEFGISQVALILQEPLVSYSSFLQIVSRQYVICRFQAWAVDRCSRNLWPSSNSAHLCIIPEYHILIDQFWCLIPPYCCKRGSFSSVPKRSRKCRNCPSRSAMRLSVSRRLFSWQRWSTVGP